MLDVSFQDPNTGLTPVPTPLPEATEKSKDYYVGDYSGMRVQAMVLNI